jgi:hypothetical protein
VLDAPPFSLLNSLLVGDQGPAGPQSQPFVQPPARRQGCLGSLSFIFSTLIQAKQSPAIQ